MQARFASFSIISSQNGFVASLCRFFPGYYQGVHCGTSGAYLVRIKVHIRGSDYRFHRMENLPRQHACRRGNRIGIFTIEFM